MKGIKVNELAARAYALIWNEWFRDENLQNPINLSTFAEISTASGLDDVGLGDAGFTGIHSLLRRGKRHDYFTSALPWPQKGPGVELPLNGNAPIKTLADGAVYPGIVLPGNPHLPAKDPTLRYFNDGELRKLGTRYESYEDSSAAKWSGLYTYYRDWETDRKSVV